MVKTLRWGIISTGWICDKFVHDLIIDPATRDVTDVKHEIVAVASRTTERAAQFVKDSCPNSRATPYGTYEELYADPNVEVVYIGTPHSHHYQHALVALTAGKHVLCEKSLTVNSAQAQALVNLAREKNLFFMEAVWIRFTPVTHKVQELIASGFIGELRSVQADLSIDWKEKEKDPGHRLVSPDLAGGALLDQGPYPWTWIALLCLPPSVAGPEPLPVPHLVASMTRTATGVDASTLAIIQFPQPDGRIIHATLSTALDAQSPPKRVVTAIGTKGFIEVEWPTYVPSAISYTAWESEDSFAALGPPNVRERLLFTPKPGDILGFAWEADEVARCIRDGKTESDRMPLRETLLMLQVFDEIRKQGGLKYPEAVEGLGALPTK